MDTMSFPKNEGGDNLKPSTSSSDTRDGKTYGSGDFGCQMPEISGGGATCFPELKAGRQAKEFSRQQRPAISPQLVGHRSFSDTMLSFPTLPAPRRRLDEFRSIFSNATETGSRSRPTWRRQPDAQYGLNASDYQRQFPNYQRFRTQERAYPTPSRPHGLDDIPKEIRWKVRSEGVVTDYFGCEITVARLQNGEIMDACVCHVVMVLNTTTEQYFVKAFTKNTRSQEGCLIKFNRLITRNNCPLVMGCTSFIFNPIYGRPDLPNYEGDKHMLNFFNAEMAAKFQSALKKASQQIWNHAAVRLQGQFDSGPRLRQNENFRRYFSAGVARLEPSVAAQTRIGSSRMFADGSYASTSGLSRDMFEMDDARVRLTPKRPKVLFRGNNVRLYLKVVTGIHVKSSVYALLGEGNVDIHENEEGYDYLLIFGANQELMLDQFIYPWVKPSIVQEVSGSTEWEMIWTAVALHLIVQDPNKVPVSRDFKLVGNKETILGLSEAIKRSSSHGLTELFGTLEPNLDEVQVAQDEGNTTFYRNTMPGTTADGQ